MYTVTCKEPATSFIMDKTNLDLIQATGCDMISQTYKQAICAIVFVLMLVAMSADAASPFILCKNSARKIAKLAGLKGSYVSSTSDITDGADVLLVGDIFSQRNSTAIHDLQEKKCRMVRLDSPVTSVLISRIKAYIRYTDSGKSVFANPQEGMRHIIYSNLNSEIENFEPTDSRTNQKTQLDYLPRPAFNQSQDTGNGAPDRQENRP